MSEIFRKLSAVYGYTVSDLPLRHALLAFATLALTESDFLGKAEVRKSRACRELIRKIHTPENICFSDLLVTFLLTFISMSHWFLTTGSPTGSEEAWVHINGYLAVSEKVLANLTDKLVSAIVYLTSDSLLDLDTRWEFKIRRQHLQIQKEFYGSGTLFGETRQHLIEFDNFTQIPMEKIDKLIVRLVVHRSFMTLLSFVMTRVHEGLENNGVPQDECLSITLSKLDDPGFLHAFHISREELSERYVFPLRFTKY
jgi:hypothetical protein